MSTPVLVGLAVYLVVGVVPMFVLLRRDGATRGFALIFGIIMAPASVPVYGSILLKRHIPQRWKRSRFAEFLRRVD